MLVAKKGDAVYITVPKKVIFTSFTPRNVRPVDAIPERFLAYNDDGSLRPNILNYLGQIQLGVIGPSNNGGIGKMSSRKNRFLR